MRDGREESEERSEGGAMRAWLGAAMPPHPRPTAGSPTKRASSSESSNGDHPYHHVPHAT